MAKYLITLFLIIFFGCEINSQQIIKPEKFKYDEVSFNSVSKNLIFEIFENNPNTINMQKIINYWYENKIKVNGFEGNLDVIIKNIEITSEKKVDYFKFSIGLDIEFNEKVNNLKRNRVLKINSNEYGEIKGNFSIKDQENLVINIMHKCLKSVNKKIKEIN